MYERVCGKGRGWGKGMEPLCWATRPLESKAALRLRMCVRATPSGTQRHEDLQAGKRWKVLEAVSSDQCRTRARVNKKRYVQISV